MKKLIVSIAAVVAFAGSAATYEENLELAKTPIAQITTANATQILDASIATTNAYALWKIIDSKTMPFSEIFAKAKDNSAFFNALQYGAKAYGTDIEQEIAFQNFIDTWLTLDAEEQLACCKRNQFATWCVYSYADRKFMAAPVVEKAVEKIASSNAPLKANAIAQMLYIYGKTYRRGLLDSACEQQFEMVKTSILNGDFYSSYQLFDFVWYVKETRNDNALCSQLLDNIKWYAPYGESTKKCPELATVNRNYEPTLSNLRKKYLATVAKNDFQLTTVALAQDKTDGTKEATKSIYSKLKDLSVKLDIALYLDDNDKLIDALIAIDNSIAPEKIEKAIVVINTFDPDFRAADVLKALRVINKKYTLKLYDDRDTWEPILSKVRALIDTYNN